MQTAGGNESKAGSLSDVVTIDGPPLDFSFKGIRDMQTLIATSPRGGNRRPIPEITEETEDAKKNDGQLNLNMQGGGNNGNPRSEEEEQEGEKKEKKEEILKAPLQPAITSILATYSYSLQSKNLPGKNYEEVKQTQIKKAKTKKITTSLVLRNNKIASLDGLENVLREVMYHPSKLVWMDLSHNRLESISKEIQTYTNLQSLYLHCNYIHNFKELVVLQKLNLRALTLYGNQIENIKGYRLYVIGILAQAKRLDSVLITRLERDNATVWYHQFGHKRLPRVTDPVKAPNTPNNSQ